MNISGKLRPTLCIWLLTVVSPRDIEKFLKGYGRIRNISVKEGFGFAEFDDRRDADDAVKVTL